MRCYATAPPDYTVRLIPLCDLFNWRVAPEADADSLALVKAIIASDEAEERERLRTLRQAYNSKAVDSDDGGGGEDDDGDDDDDPTYEEGTPRSSSRNSGGGGGGDGGGGGGGGGGAGADGAVHRSSTPQARRARMQHAIATEAPPRGSSSAAQAVPTHAATAAPAAAAPAVSHKTSHTAKPTAGATTSAKVKTNKKRPASQESATGKGERALWPVAKSLKLLEVLRDWVRACGPPSASHGDTRAAEPKWGAIAQKVDGSVSGQQCRSRLKSIKKLVSVRIRAPVCASFEVRAT